MTLVDLRSRPDIEENYLRNLVHHSIEHPDICRDARLNHRLEVVDGVLADRCAALLTSFFAARREAQASERAESGMSRRSQRRSSREP